MAWLPPTQGRYSCERCGRTTEQPEGWLQLEVREAGDEPVTHDFCAICKTTVRRAIKQMTPRAPKAARVGAGS